MVCSKCKKELMDDMAFCPYCGNKVEKAVCPKCGAPLVADAKFCSSCGAPAEQTTPADDEKSQLIENAPISEEAFPKSSVLQESHTAKEDNKPITLYAADIEGGGLNANLVNVIIDDSVTEIKEKAFSGCKELTSITIPDSVTVIGNYAFEGCTNLTSITIPNSVTEIGWYAFSDCTNLTSITIPDSVTEIDGWAFSDCTNLTSITIPNSVTVIGEGAFKGCTNLTSITIPDSVIKIGINAFSHCTNLTSITIPDSVTKIGAFTFKYCTNLTSITIPDSVTKIDWGAFEGCTNLTSITIPNSVTDIGMDAFSECTNLTSITIPDSVTEIVVGAFKGCTNLTSITIPDSVTKIGRDAFKGCTNLTSITIPDSVTEIGDNAFADTRFLVKEKAFDYNKTVLEKHDYKKLDTKYSNFLVKEQYKSKGETKYRYTYTSGGIEGKFTMNASYYNKCWHYDNCLFVNVGETLYMHKGASSQLRYLCEIGTNIDLFCNNGDVIAVGSKGYLMCSTNSKALTRLEMPEDKTRFLYGVYNDGSISIGSSVPDNVCVINKDKKIESKKISALMKHICNNISNNKKIFNYDNTESNYQTGFYSGFDYYFDCGIESFVAESGKSIKLIESDGRIYYSSDIRCFPLCTLSCTPSDWSGEDILKHLDSYRAYLIDQSLRSKCLKKYYISDYRFIALHSRYICFLGWEEHSFMEKPDCMHGLYRIIKGELYRIDKEDFITSGKKLVWQLAPCLDNVKFNSPTTLSQERYTPVFEKLTAIERYNLYVAGNEDYEKITIGVEDVDYELIADDEGVVFVYKYTAYFWRLSDNQLLSCPYDDYDVSKGKENNFQPVIIKPYISQKSIPAPSTFVRYNSYGLDTVNSALKQSGYSITKNEGAGLELSFTELEIVTERDGKYYDSTPSSEKPSAKYSLDYLCNETALKVQKCKNMSAYTIDARYGFIYSVGGKVYRWIGVEDSELSNMNYWGLGEVVSLLVLGDYLLISGISWLCQRSGIDHEYLFGGGYTTSEYYCTPSLLVYNLSQNKTIKEIKGVGVFPEYFVNANGQFVIKIIHSNKSDNSNKSNANIVNLTLTNLDTAFDWIAQKYSTCSY